jgi:hypothetical protein
MLGDIAHETEDVIGDEPADRPARVDAAHTGFILMSQPGVISVSHMSEIPVSDE